MRGQCFSKGSGRVGGLRLRTTQQNICPHMMLEESEDSGFPISHSFLVFTNLFLCISILGGSV